MNDAGRGDEEGREQECKVSSKERHAQRGKERHVHKKQRTTSSTPANARASSKGMAQKKLIRGRAQRKRWEPSCFGARSKAALGIAHVGDRVHGPSVKSTWQSALARQSLLYVTPPAHTGRKMRGQGTLRRGTQSMDGTAATDDFGASHAEDVTQTPSLRIGVDGGHSQRATHCMVQMGEEFSHDGVHALPHSFQTMPPVHCLSDGGGFFGVVVINVANEVESSCRSEVSASPKVTTAMEAPPAGCCRFADVRSKVFVHGCSYT
uniref:Uncharacterized protein n=1 Tax=Chrysotila carterae TaxID=13221 RepID=A0A7S4B989_CHRCT